MRCWINKVSNERNKVLIAKSPWNLNLLFLRQTCCWIIYYSVKHKMNYQPAYQQKSQIGTILPFWSHPHCSMENSSSYTTWSGVPRGIVVNPILIPIYISEWIKHSNIIYIYNRLFWRYHYLREIRHKSDCWKGRRGRDRMIVGFSTSCAISACHH